MDQLAETPTANQCGAHAVRHARVCLQEPGRLGPLNVPLKGTSRGSIRGAHPSPVETGRDDPRRRRPAQPRR